MSFGIPCLSSIYYTQSNVYKVVAAQRTGALIAALEPPEQADRVEGVLAGGTALVRGLHVCRDDRVTDSALTLTLQSTLNVAAERQQAIDQVTIGKHDDSLDRKKPVLPLLFVNQHSTAADNQCGVKGVCGWQRDRNRDGWRFLVNGDAGDDLGCLWGYLDTQSPLLVRVLGGNPVGDTVKGIPYHKW